MDNDTTYNGWKNRETWNVSLWINNDESLYNEAVKFATHYPGDNTYLDFICFAELQGASTPDGVPFDDPALDIPRLNEMLNDFKEH